MRVDRTEWPLAEICLDESERTSGVEQYVAALVDLALRGESYAVLVDIRDQAELDAVQRRRLATLLDRQRETLASGLVGQAIVTKNVLQRGVVTAIQWMMEEPGSCRVFDSRLDAIRWLRRELERAPPVATAS